MFKVSKVNLFYPLIVAVPFTALSFSPDMIQNVSNFVVGYLLAYAIFYVFGDKEKKDEKI